MPRIFQVTLTKAIDCTVVAESAEELEAALEEQTSEFDEWALGGWEIAVHDPYQRLKSAEKIPKTFKEPDMGVLEGECVAISDYCSVKPNYMTEVQHDADQVALKLNLDTSVPSLFPRVVTKV